MLRMEFSGFSYLQRL